MNCKDCKYYETEFTYDDEIIHYCSKHHKLNFLFRRGCKDYEKYTPKPYVEELTECDECKYLSECKSTVEITMSLDTQRHFMRGMGGKCKKYEEKIV